MLKSVIGALLVFRLELRTLMRESGSATHQPALHRKLDEVYPF